MDFTFDPRKAEINFSKHNVSFAEAESVFYDPRGIHIDDPHPNEDRFVAIGLGGQGRLLVVVYTYRKLSIRLISARRATKREIIEYEK